MIEEEWRPVVGAAGLYEVSDLGRVRRTGIAAKSRDGKTRRTRARIMRQCRDGKGYLACNICIGGTASMRLVHRLMAAAFLGASGDFVVNHRDAVIGNNLLANLEVCDHAYNLMYASRVMGNRRGEKCRTARLTDAKVEAILAMSALGFTGRDIANTFGVHFGTISDILTGKCWMHVSKYRLMLDPMQRVGNRRRSPKEP